MPIFKKKNHSLCAESCGCTENLFCLVYILFYFCSKHRLWVHIRTEPFQRGDSNEYPQPMFWNKNKKNRYTPAYPFFKFSFTSLSNYFSSYETGQSVGSAKTREPREKPPDTPASLYPSFAIY